MLFRFMGTYTGDRDSINAGGVIFHDRDPANVEDPELIRRLSNNVEFQKMHGVTQASVDDGVQKAKDEIAKFDHDGDGKAGGSKARGKVVKATKRPRKLPRVKKA